MDPSVPDSVSADQLRSLLLNGQLFPVIDALPSLTFGHPAQAHGTGDLYFVVTALLDKASNAPYPLQVMALICGMLQSLVRTSETTCADGATFQVDPSLLPPGIPQPTPEMLEGLREGMQRQARKLRRIYEDLDEIQGHWLVMATAAYVRTSGLPVSKAIERANSSTAVVSPEMTAALGLTASDIEDFCKRVRKEP